jgi:hypothetical protein
MNNQNYLTELEDIIEVIKIDSNKSYIIGNQSYDLASNNNKNKYLNLDSRNSTDFQKQSLLETLGNHLYQIFHCKQNINQQIFTNQNYFDNRNFVELLSNANTGIGTWDPGWEVSKIENNGRFIVVKKNDLNLWIFPYQFNPFDSDQIRVGKKGYILMVKEFRELLPGFYMANGNISLDEHTSIVRIYWNIVSDGAIYLMKSLTTELNRAMIPFQFKILNNTNYFIRADAGVLYLNKKDLEKSTGALSKIYNNIKSFLKVDTPLFAKRLATGISFAEDPQNGESFGQNRSRILSESIYEIYKKNISKKKDKIKEVRNYFEIKNIDINRPYLKDLKSIDEYEKILNGVFD